MNDGRFKKGQIPWNKGLKNYMGANRTSFSKDTVKRSTYLPRKARDGNIITSKTELVPQKSSKTGKMYMHHKRMQNARFVIMQQGITIPDGHIVFHIDGDKYNDDIKNLEIISRAELAKRNKQKRATK